MSKTEDAKMLIESVRLYRAFRGPMSNGIVDSNGPSVTVMRSAISALDEFLDFVETIDASGAAMFKAGDMADYWHRIPGYESTGKPA